LLSPETLPVKGIYTLIILLNRKSRLRVRKLGCFSFQRGHYAYTGSALGLGATSLRKRVARHLRNKKAKHWHIDFLLANRNARVIAVVMAESSISKECQINNLIRNIEGATVPVVGFGASDCKQNCKSHLLYYGEENIQEKIVDAYEHLFGPNVAALSLSDTSR